jgi:hypothetical protein
MAIAIDPIDSASERVESGLYRGFVVVGHGVSN